MIIENQKTLFFTDKEESTEKRTVIGNQPVAQLDAPNQGGAGQRDYEPFRVAKLHEHKQAGPAGLENTSISGDDMDRLLAGPVKLGC